MQPAGPDVPAACSEFQADGLATALEGAPHPHPGACPDCAALLARSREHAVRLARLPSHPLPPGEWPALVASLRLARRRRIAATVAAALSGLAAALLLALLLSPFMTPVQAERGERPVSPEPRLAMERPELLLLADTDH